MATDNMLPNTRFAANFAARLDSGSKTFWVVQSPKLLPINLLEVNLTSARFASWKSQNFSQLSSPRSAAPKTCRALVASATFLLGVGRRKLPHGSDANHWMHWWWNPWPFWTLRFSRYVTYRGDNWQDDRNILGEEPWPKAKKDLKWEEEYVQVMQSAFFYPLVGVHWTFK